MSAARLASVLIVGLLVCAPAAAELRPQAALDAAEAAIEQGDYAAASEALLQAVGAAADGLDRVTRSRVLRLEAQVLADLGDLASAEAKLSKALELLAGSPRVEELVRLLSQSGRVAMLEGDLEGASARLAEAARWARTLPAGSESSLPLLRAKLARLKGERDRAEQLVADAQRRCSSVATCARATLGSGTLALERGEAAEAKRLLEEAERELAERGQRRQRARALLALARAHGQLGEIASLERRAEEARDLAADIGFVALEAEAAHLLGEVALDGGDLESARRHLEAAQRHYRAMRSRPGMAASRLVLARLETRAGSAPEAQVHLRAARRAYLSMGDSAGLAEAARAAAELARRTADVAEERRQLERLLDLRPAGAEAWWALTRLGELDLQGRPTAAAARLRQAVAEVERLRASRVGARERERFLEARLETYDLLLRALARDGGEGGIQHAHEALVVSERSVSRSFSDLLERARLQPVLSPLLGARVQRAVDATLDDLVAESAILKYHLADERSWLFVVVGGRVQVLELPGREAIAADVAELTSSMTRPRRTAVERRRQRKVAERLFGTLLAPALPHIGDRRRLVVVPHRDLRLVPFEALVAPEGLDLEGIEGPIGGPRYAIYRYTFSYAPSIASLAELHRQARRREGRTNRHPVIAFGDPRYGSVGLSQPLERLVHSGTEARRAAALLDGGGVGTLYLGEAASEERLKTLALSRYRIVHLATHAVADDALDKDRQPALILGRTEGDDGVLRMAEVFDLDLDADLVVLSACSSARGPLRAGEGLGGLTRAFLYAGASSVLATLWAVEDAHTATLMERFYEGVAANKGRADALREARLALLTGAVKAPEAGKVRGIGGIIDPDAEAAPHAKRKRRPRRAQPKDPFFWAPFVLIGDTGDTLR